VAQAVGRPTLHLSNSAAKEQYYCKNYDERPDLVHDYNNAFCSFHVCIGALKDIAFVLAAGQIIGLLRESESNGFEGPVKKTTITLWDDYTIEIWRKPMWQVLQRPPKIPECLSYAFAGHLSLLDAQDALLCPPEGPLPLVP
jgi:hypothetical protein